jgi:acetyl esterase
MTAEIDPLRDEGEEFAKRLLKAGIPTRHYRAIGMTHGFLRARDFSDSALDGQKRLGEALRRNWGPKTRPT